MTMTPILANIDDVADSVKLNIERIGQRASRKFLFADIRDACIEKRAFIFISGENDGFVVLRPMPERTVQVWVAYSKEGDAIEKYQPFLQKICRDIDANRIEFETAIDAMGKHAEKYGWEKAYSIYRMKL